MKAVLIGLGQIGLGYDLDKPDLVQTHAKALSMFGLDVTAVDPSHDSRAKAEQVYGFTTVSKVEKLPSGQNFDLIVIASPTTSHLENLRWAIGKVPKVILIEKPLCSNDSELKSMTDLVNQSKTKVLVNVIRNFDAFTLRELQRFLLEGGERIDITYSIGLRHNGIHFLALMIKAFGKPDSHKIVDRDRVSPEVTFDFERFTVVFKPDKAGDNTMILHASNRTTRFVQGGRTIYITRGDNRDMVFTQRLGNYQEVVMQNVLNCMAGGGDDSFQCALEAQYCIENILEECSE